MTRHIRCKDLDSRTRTCMQSPIPTQRSYSIPIPTLVEQLATTPATGLSSAEAKQRLQKHGANLLRQIRPRSALKILLDQFRSLLVWLLVAATGIAFGFGEWMEGTAIAAVLVIKHPVRLRNGDQSSPIRRCPAKTDYAPRNRSSRPCRTSDCSARFGSGRHCAARGRKHRHCRCTHPGIEPTTGQRIDPHRRIHACIENARGTRGKTASVRTNQHAV